MIQTPDVPFIAITTLACVLMIGLGFLPRPSVATAMWSFAFALGMLASYALLAAGLADSALLRGLGSGIFLPANALIWVGLRAAAGRRHTMWQVAVAYLIASPVALIATAGTNAYSVTFRADFAVAAIFGALIVAELVRMYPTYRDVVLPMMLGGALFPVFAVYGILEGVMRALEGTTAADDLAGVRSVNSVGTGVYVVCAVVSLLLLARHDAPAASGSAGGFDEIARARLVRARAAADEWWSVVEVRLDDPADIRTALGGSTFARVAGRFRADVLAELPADADYAEVDETTFVILVPRSQEAVRRLVIAILDRVSRPDPERRLPLRVSASIGWAPAQIIGYELDALRAAATDAASIARAKGGDRWERTTAPCDAAPGVR
ncbi:hypothetical protein [Microbacterium excoecariae]|uniref:hypothetical protein n=1 Tax=Microbacterium excoecariae TaxID=2715210 RepID=UPI00140CA9CA|nr:hypothetical protein [Microbacterium excoecariae]NHI17595.1 hypothetical protein [Microbacterium excoecariae]